MKSAHHRAALFAVASAIALTIALTGTAASAQTAAAPADDKVGEIIVTAQKRSENLQKVPLAISVASQAVLQNNNIVNAEGLDQVVPSLTFKKGTANVNSTLSIRGIGTQSFSSGAEPSVSTVVDGIVFGRSGMAFQEFTDLDHIEVLRGPQGTLFGKNASAGVVNIVSKAPSATALGNVSFGYYEGGEYRADAYLSGPITSTIRYALSGVWGDYSGNIYNAYQKTWTNGYRHQGLRGVLVDELSPSLKFTLRADYVHADDNCCADVLGPYVAGSSNFANILLPSISPVQAVNGSKAVYDDLTPGTRDGNGGVSGQFDYTFHDFTLTSITGWREWRNKQIRDGDFHATNSNYANSIDIADADFGALNYNQYSEELRLASPAADRLQYVVGAFFWYTTENDWFNRFVNQCTASKLPADATGFSPCSTTPGVSTLINAQGPAAWRTIFENQALFGQATYAVTDKLKLIGGLRLTHDHVQYSLARTSYVAGTPNAPAGIQPNFQYSEHADKDGVSGKAGAEYQLTSDAMVYATYSRGYKGPSLNDFYSEYTSNVGTVPSESSDAYELGAKTQFLNRRLTVNADVFWEDFSNFQANTFVLQGSTTFVTLGNAGNVRSRGVEFDLNWRATSDLTFSGGYTFDDATIVKYNCTGAQTVYNATPTTTNQQTLAKCLAHDNKVLPFAPKNKFNVTADYHVPLPPSLPFDMKIDATYSYTSTINFDLDQSALAKQPSYGLFDMSAVISSKDGRYKLAVIGKNLGDTYYTTFVTPGGAGPAPGTLGPLRVGSFTRLQIPRDAQRYLGVKLTAGF